MFSNFLKIAVRNLLKNKFFSLINILGLATSITCALLVIFHVKQELSYDRNYLKSDRIFRITQEGIGKDTRHWAATPPPLAPSLLDEFTEIEQSVRFHRPSPEHVLSYTPVQGGVKRFEEKSGFFADAAVTDVFNIRFSSGNAGTALIEKNSIVLTEQMAEKYFGSEDPIGKIIKDDATNFSFTVTGVIQSPSFPTHLQFDYLLSMPTLTSYQDQQTLQRRTWSGFYTYVVLKKAEFKQRVESKLSSFMVKFYAPTGETASEILAKRRLHLQPITDIHLHSKLEKEMGANSDITYVYIFSIAALFIILIASVNFINMSTAQALKRVKEIGVRKLVGATKRKLIVQFLGESVLVTFLATLVAIFLCKAAISWYNEVAGRSFQWMDIFTFSNVAVLVGLMIAIGLLAGAYPAWFIANFKTIASLRSKKVSGTSVNMVRKSLVVFQFAVSVLMIFSTIIVYQQLTFFHKKELGFDKEQVIAVKIYGQMREHIGSLSDEMKRNAAIVNFSLVSGLPGERFGTQPFRQLSEDKTTDQQSARLLWADDQLLSALQISLKEGRNFFRQFPQVKRDEFLLNETAAKSFGPGDPLGKTYIADRDTGVIVGIVKDFNFASLHSTIDPLVIQYRPERTNYMLVKIKGGQIPQVLKFMQSTIKDQAPSAVFTYTFLEDQLNRLYESENRMSRIFKAFALFAVLISCLGLFGLSAYAARVRTKEVGIRKVLGASVYNVTLLLSKDFIALVLVAILVALPLAGWMMNKWLEGFAYRIDIHPSIFLLSGGFAIVIAFLTVSVHAVKAGLINPVNSLKSE